MAQSINETTDMGSYDNFVAGAADAGNADSMELLESMATAVEIWVILLYPTVFPLT